MFDLWDMTVAVIYGIFIGVFTMWTLMIANDNENDNKKRRR